MHDLLTVADGDIVWYRTSLEMRKSYHQKAQGTIGYVTILLRASGSFLPSPQNVKIFSLAAFAFLVSTWARMTAQGLYRYRHCT